MTTRQTWAIVPRYSALVRSTNPRTWLVYSVVVIIVGVILLVTTGSAGVILIIGGLLVGVRSARELRR